VFFVPSTLLPRRARTPRRGPTPLDLALAREKLASDRLRSGVLAGFLTVFMLVYFSFYFYFPDVDLVVWHGRIDMRSLGGLFGSAVVFELLVFTLLSHYLQQGRRPPQPMIYCIALVETSFPTAILLVFSRVMDPMVALTLTPTHHYYFFILLSTLRLNPRLCIFTGAVASLEYAALAVSCMLRDPGGDDMTLTVLPLHVWKAALYFMAGMAAAFVASQVRKQVANALKSVEDQKHIRDVFGKHVSPQVVDQLLRQDVVADGEVRHVCVMFLDIRDFTARSSRMQPEAVVSYLNTLFDFMIECINRRNGIVNKFLGDGFMAVFGAPVSDGRDSYHAVAAAREILQRVDAMNAFADGEPTRIGMGLHAGPVLAGNVGSSQRKEYTIIGDTVNLASRIEGLNKQFGSRLLVSEEVWRECSADLAEAERLGPVAVKGKEEPIPVYKLS
jgi:adenylate cyclase